MEAKLRVREKEQSILNRNLKYIPEPLKSELEKIEATLTPIDDDILIQGIKNPLLTVFIGMSTRKLLESLKRKKKKTELIVVIEPNIARFKELISTEDISDLLQANNVEFILGLTGGELLTNLFRVLTSVESGGFLSRATKMFNMEKIVDPFSYSDKDGKPSQIALDIIKTIDETINHIVLSTGCSDDQSRRFELMVQNRHNMFKAWNMTGLVGKFDKTVAIALGGGPTLDEFIEAYKKYPNLKNCLLMACDAVLFKLLKNDIRPHMVFRCERKHTQIFKGITKDMCTGIYYCAYPWTPVEYFNLFEDSFYLFRNNGVCVFTDMKHSFVDGGVSSGNAIVEAALSIGCETILTAGIDLCMPGGKTHTDDTQVEFNPELSRDKWSKIETYGGTMETTVPVFVRCLNEYGQSIDKHRNIKKKNFKFYGTSTKSAKILGAEYMPWEKAQELCAEPIKVAERIEKYRAKVPQSEIDNFYKICADALKNIKDIKEGVNVNFGLERDARNTCNNEISKLMKKTYMELLPIENGSIKIEHDKTWALIRSIRMLGPNLEKLTKNIADSYDTNFKNKYYNNKYYRICILDVLQHDTLMYENKVNGLANTLDFNDDKYLAYCDLTRDFLIKVDFYCDKFIGWFEEVLRDKQL